MAKTYYSADSAHDPHPLLTAASRCMPPDGIVACTLPPHAAGVSITSLTRS
jgi:hypothetical protein